MAYNNLNTKQLTKKIKERKKFLTKVVNFAEKLLQENSIETRRAESTYHIHIIKKLVGFDHFSFLVDWGQTDMGGNDIKIWYHPNIASIDMERSRPVLHVYYQPAVFCVDDIDCEIKQFDEDTEWQTAIMLTIVNKNKYPRANEQNHQRKNCRTISRRRKKS